jgi:hypothetical protein
VARNSLDFLPFVKHLRASRKKNRVGASSVAPARDPMAERRCTVVEAEDAAEARMERAASAAPRRRRGAMGYRLAARGKDGREGLVVRLFWWGFTRFGENGEQKWSVWSLDRMGVEQGTCAMRKIYCVHTLYIN